MRELYNEFFRISKHEKISEKVMLTRIATTVSIVILCLAAMSITAYAYFSHNITSASNMVKAANFEAKVSITKTEPTSGSVTVSDKGRTQNANLDAGKYTVELSKGDSTADKGFCIITIGDEKYYSDQIGVDLEKNLTDAKVRFDLILSAPTKIEVTSHWGTSVYYGYKDAGRTEIFIVDGTPINLTVQTTSDDGESEKNTDPSTETTKNTSTDTEKKTESSSTQASDSTTTPSITTPPENTESAETGGTAESENKTTEPDATQQTPSTETTDADSTKAAESEDSETKSTTDQTETTDTPAAKESEDEAQKNELIAS